MTCFFLSPTDRTSDLRTSIQLEKECCKSSVKPKRSQEPIQRESRNKASKQDDGARKSSNLDL